MSRKVWLTVGAVVLALALVTLPFVYLSARPSEIEENAHGVRLWMKGDRRLVLPGICTTISWEVEGAETILINNAPTPNARGAEIICPTKSTWLTISAAAPNGETIKETIYVGVFLSTLTTQVATAGAAIFVLVVGMITAHLNGLPIHSVTRAIDSWRRLVQRVKTGRALLIAGLRREFFRRDARYITFLAVMAGIPLIVFRYEPQPLIGWVILIVWLFTAWRWAAPSLRVAVRGRKRPPLAQTVLVPLCLFMMTILGFYVPMQGQFWGGGDEFYVLEQDDEPLWSPHFDRQFNRPLVPMGASIATRLTPDYVDGFLWLAFVMRLLSSALVYAIVRALFRRKDGLALAAAILFIVNPSESSRFLVIHMNAYPIAVFLTLFSLWLFIRSHQQTNRLLLITACAMLGLSLAIVETGFLMSVVALVALLFTRKPHLKRITWMYAWLVTIVLFALRYIQFQMFVPTTYQGSMLEGIHFTQLVDNARFQFGQTFSFFQVPQAPLEHWLYGAAVAVIGGLVVAAFVKTSQMHQRETYFVGLVAAGFSTVLAVALYIPLGGVLRTIRTQFYAAPAQAVLWTLLIALVSLWLPTRLRRGWIASIAAVMLLLSTVSALQLRENRAFNPGVTYERTVKIAQSLRAIAQGLPDDAAVVLMPANAQDNVLGSTYHVVDFGKWVFGVPGYQVGYTDSLGTGFRFVKDGIGGSAGYAFYPYSRLVVFEVRRDGTVKLIERLPDALLPEDAHDADSYDPHALIERGTPKALAYLH